MKTTLIIHKTSFFLLFFIFLHISTYQLINRQSGSQIVEQNNQKISQKKIIQGQILTTPRTQFLLGESYKGYYQSLQQSNLFEYLDTKEGEIEALFYSDPLKSSAFSLNTLQIFLFNPKYHDLKAVGILINLDQINEDGKWTLNNATLKIQKFWKGRSYSDQETIENVTYIIELINFITQDPSEVQVNIQIHAPMFNFKSSLNYYHDILSTLGYSLYTTLVVGLQIFCAVSILKQIDRENPAIISKMSLLTLSICNIEDFYFTMMHIQYIMSSGAAYLFYVLPSMAYLILFVIFDMKMLFLVWRSHHMRDIQNAQALRKKLTTFYIEFYLGLFIYLTLNYFFEYESWLIFIQHMILVPQIVHNVRKGNNPGFSFYYIVGFLGLRYMIPLYIRGCPGNHFTLEPMPILVSVLGLFYAVQILILYLQAKYGPRFFVPKFLLPNYYQYNVKLKLTQQNKQIDCSICLLNIFAAQPVPPSNINESMATRQQLLDQIHIMKTPCNHYFHKQCLTKWIDVKLQCPTCRKPLPAM